jgi:hypothetical protein
VVMAVYEMPGAILPHRRWVKAYPSRADAAWDAERLGLVSPNMATALKEHPLDQVIPALSAYVRDPKETLRSFVFFPITQEQ